MAAVLDSPLGLSSLPPPPHASAQAASAAERADLELLLMDDGALRDAARGVKSRVLPVDHDAGDAGKRKLTKKVQTLGPCFP